MSLRAHVSDLIQALPAGASVTLSREQLERWLEEPAQAATTTEPTDTQPLAPLTCEAVAEALDRTPACIRSWCREGKMDGAYRLHGREWRIPRAALQAYLAAQAAPPKPNPTPDLPRRGDTDLGGWRDEMAS